MLEKADSAFSRPVANFSLLLLTFVPFALLLPMQFSQNVQKAQKRKK
jgi:hypothetical protein